MKDKLREQKGFIFSTSYVKNERFHILNPSNIGQVNDISEVRVCV